jgi:histidinol-phosphate phosphatase family protein
LPEVVYDVVVPTIGRASLAVLLQSLAASTGPPPRRVILVDDRRDRSEPLALGDAGQHFAERLDVVAGTAAGPAAARNHGWRAARAAWIAFLDDDVVVDRRWRADLVRDLSDLPVDVAGSQGCVRVPLPADRAPTDWERNVAGLEGARWITADCAYRRDALAAVGGFDERFPRAYREDADLGLRIVARGLRIVQGTRRVEHPVRPADWRISLRLQAGNADDVLMQALHGRDWRERAGAPPGAFRVHVATVFAAGVAAAGTCAWALLTARFAWRRIAPGPRTAREIATMLATSALLPFAAVGHRVRARLRLPAMLADSRAPRPLPRAVIFDRDGTLVVDVPGNRDPARVMPMPGARAALERLRSAGIATAIVTNQAGSARGELTARDVDAINAQVDALLGPLGPAFVCPHSPDDGCGCRKPAPGLIAAAAAALGVPVADCVVIGDIGADVEAAAAAGARSILIPTAVTRAEEIASAPVVAGDLGGAVEIVLGGAA